MHEVVHRNNEINLFVRTQHGEIAVSYRDSEPITEDLRTWLGKRFRIEGNAKHFVSPDIEKSKSILMCSDRSQIQLKDKNTITALEDYQATKLKVKTVRVC